MIMIGVCDDQASDRESIISFIRDICASKKQDITILPFQSGEALEKHYIMNGTSLDIIFLDIYMGGMNGILTAKKIRMYDQDSKIIFTTSSTAHALESFSVFPFHYLIKPISKTDFHITFDRAFDLINHNKQKSLIIKVGSCLQTIYFKDILYVESRAKILTIYTPSGKTFSFSAKLDDIHNQLQDKRFTRCHKSFLINMDYVSSLENHAFKLINNAQISITQRNYASIKKIFYDYLLAMSNISSDLNKEVH